MPGSARIRCPAWNKLPWHLLRASRARMGDQAMRVAAVVAVLSLSSIASTLAWSQVAPDKRDLQVEGKASYYADDFQGKKTATGDTF